MELSSRTIAEQGGALLPTEFGPALLSAATLSKCSSSAGWHPSICEPSQVPIQVSVSVSTADEAVELGRIFGQMASYMTKLHGNRLSDRNVLMGALHDVLDVAEKRNCCSLTAFAMRSAHQLGFKDVGHPAQGGGRLYISPPPLRPGRRHGPSGLLFTARDGLCGKVKPPYSPVRMVAQVSHSTIPA